MNKFGNKLAVSTQTGVENDSEEWNMFPKHCSSMLSAIYTDILSLICMYCSGVPLDGDNTMQISIMHCCGSVVLLL